MKRTALYSAHQKLGAKLIDFGGWEMPVQYTSITDEHLAVRNAAGIFDISHRAKSPSAARVRRSFSIAHSPTTSASSRLGRDNTP